MNNIKFKRIMAYLIDFFIVVLIVSLLSGIKKLNPKYEEYKEASERYTDYYESNFSNTTVELDDYFAEEFLDITHDVSLYSIAYNVVEIVVIILYFTLFPFFFGGQTIGKKMFKIKIVSQDDDKVSFFKYLLRSSLIPSWSSIVLYNVYTLILNIVFALLFKGKVYLYANLITTYLITLVLYVDIFFMLSRKDHRSLHDIICKTKVVEV